HPERPRTAAGPASRAAASPINGDPTGRRRPIVPTPGTSHRHARRAAGDRGPWVSLPLRATIPEGNTVSAPRGRTQPRAARSAPVQRPAALRLVLGRPLT